MKRRNEDVHEEIAFRKSNKLLESQQFMIIENHTMKLSDMRNQLISNYEARQQLFFNNFKD